MVFFVDGLDLTRLDAGIAAGELPNIAERFARGGVRVRHAIASMPSNTYPNTVSLLTGQFPGHHGILGNRWYDHASRRFEHYTSPGTFRNANDHFDDPTLFEMLDDRLTIAVQLHTRRGATVTIDRSLTGGYRWLFGGYESFDRRPAKYLTRIARIANRRRRWPSLIVNYFPGVDEIGHRCGPDSQEYRSALRNVDQQIGYITASLEQAGLADFTYFVLVSDHGHVAHDPSTFLDVADFLHDRPGAIVLNGAFRRCAIHLTGPTSSSSSQPNLAAQLAQHPAVELAVYPIETDRVGIVSAHGAAAIQRRCDASGASAYRLNSTEGDPLDILDDPTLRAFVAGGWHSSQEWLAATAAESYPDFVPQVVEMFDSRRAGDIVLFASQRGTFELNGKGGHGSCLASDMNVPMFFSGPGLPRGGRIEYARSLDLTPTVLDLLGVPLPPSAGPMDGISIAERLRNAATTTQ